MSNVSSPPTEERSQILWRYVRVLWKRKWLIALCAVVAGLASYYHTKQQPPVYRAAAKIIITQTAPQVVPDFQQVAPLGAGGYWGNEYYNTQYDIIRGRKVAASAAKLLNLHQDSVFLGTDPASLSPEEALSRAADRITGQVGVSTIPDSLIALIAIDDTDPKRAALLANAVAQAYIAQNLSTALDTADNAEDDLGGQIAELERSLKKSEDELLAFQKENVLLSPRDESGNSITDQRLYSLNTELDQVRRERRELEWQKRQAQLLEKSGDFLSVPVEEVLKSDLIANLKQDYITAQDELLELRSKYLEKHPLIIRQEERVAWLKENLDREVKNVLGAIEQKYAKAAEQESKLKADLDKTLEDALQEAEKKVRYRQLQRKVDDDEKLFSQVLQRYREISFTKALTGNNVELLEEARTPGAPYKPDLRYSVMIGFLAGLAAGLALAVLFELLDSTLKSEADAEQSFGAPFLGLIPALKPEEKESADLYAYRHPKSLLSEGYRSIRTNILFASHAKEPRTLLLTSPSPQEGKTTTALNLAAVMATSGTKTILVDTDMRRPRVHKAVGASNERGLTTVVLGEATIDEVVLATEVPGLFILPCGPIPPNPSEILGGARFREIKEQLMERFDRVIFDSPPVIAVTDAAVLGAQVDGVVLVANAEKTTKDLARQTGLRLRAVNAPVLGVIMNAVNLNSKSYHYAYYYNRYEYYGENPSEAKPGGAKKKGK